MSVQKVNVPVSGASTCPVQRAENVSTPTVASGEPVPQLKFTVASVRTTLETVRSMLSKYSPRSPVPVPLPAGPYTSSSHSEYPYTVPRAVPYMRT